MRLTVLDIPKAIVFYELLGLELIVHTHEAYARLELPDGDTTLSLSLVEELPKGTGIKVFFECDDLDLKLAYLKTKEVSFKKDPIDQSWLWVAAHLVDLNRNHLIVYPAVKNRISALRRKL
ncbi:glyoxalase/bleomycin resistance/extradiol dioxygenase family protein [Nonlabens sp. MB-3u-79]|uniref:VOC family protein n=1 Tax=Nonlabens sp. MB-3u-79 TaxID=2058134 RepID=UPI000C3104D6|nr:glyoxalase/bleomycin resistance/extradiol dioxygenase family protein [Nonlabens sp. MB-3u-79]